MPSLHTFGDKLIPVTLNITENGKKCIIRISQSFPGGNYFAEIGQY